MSLTCSNPSSPVIDNDQSKLQDNISISALDELSYK